MRAPRSCRSGSRIITATTSTSPRASTSIRSASPSRMPSASPRDSTPWCLGEPQILGQLKDAYRVAHETGSTGPSLNKLFQAAFSAAKRVRSETQIGANAVSLASAAVSLARRMYADLERAHALMIGAGEMIDLDGPAFHERGGEAAGDRQPHLGAGTGARRRSQGLRGRPDEPRQGARRMRTSWSAARRAPCR